MIRRCILIFAIFLAGCGYTQLGDDPTGAYQWHSLYREDIQTVAVPIFTNKSYTRGVEFSLTKAVVNDLEARTPYKVVSRDHAQTVLEGEITSIQKQTVSKDTSTALPQEQLLIVTIDFVWKDIRSGQILVERRNFEQTTPYYPTLGEDQFIGNQQSVERLATAIVQELEANW